MQNKHNYDDDFTLTEVAAIMQKLKSGKTAGKDQISTQNAEGIE